MAALFSGVDEGLVKGWADWHGEVVDRKAVAQDETLAALKDTLDKILERNPDGPLRDMRKEHWYSMSLLPASERRRVHWQNRSRRREQIKKIWGQNWESLLDPSKRFPQRTRYLALTVFRIRSVGRNGYPSLGLPLGPGQGRTGCPTGSSSSPT
jgi:hypothetical protein